MPSERAAGARCLLAVGAHPDDVEFGCGGILAKEIARGNEAVILTLSRGEAATSGTPDARRREAEAAAAVLGARLETLDLEGDCRIEHTPKNALAIAGVIRRVRPHLVLAPSPDENQHPDHARAGRLARDAARLARYGGLAGLQGLEAHAIDALWFYDITGSGGPAAPAGCARVIVDISEVFGTWKTAMACHASQMRTRDYVDLLVARSRALGAEIGVAHAVSAFSADPIRADLLTALGATGRRF
jgi:LmbE family N-acetylglucosaminyl deacetylase